MNEQQAIQVLKGFGLDALVQNDGSYRVFNRQGLEQAPIPNINALISRAGYLQSTRPVPQPVGRFWGGRPMLPGASQPGAITRGLTVLPREDPSDPMTTEQLRAITAGGTSIGAPATEFQERGTTQAAENALELERIAPYVPVLNNANMTVTPTGTGTYIVVDHDQANMQDEMTAAEIAVMSSTLPGGTPPPPPPPPPGEDPLPDIYFEWSVLARTPKHTAGILSGAIADPGSMWMIKREDGRIIPLTSAAMMSEELAAISQLLQGLRPLGGLQDDGKVLAADMSREARDYIAGQVPGALPPLAAIPENIPEAEKRARNAEAIEGVPYEVYVDGDQLKNRPVEVKEDFRPRFDVDNMGRTIVQNYPDGEWSVVEPETPLTVPQQIGKLFSEGKYDEAAKLDQIYDQLNEERLTPERAAEMLIDIAYNPADFKQMMDAMLGRDSGLDPTTVDIPALQRQATAMLQGKEGEGLPELPQGFRDLASGAVTGQDLTLARYQPPAIEGDISADDPDQVVVPPRLYGQRAVDRDAMRQRGFMPPGRLTPSEGEDYVDEEQFERDVAPSNLAAANAFQRTQYDPTADPMAYIRASRNLADQASWKPAWQLSAELGRELTPEETTAAAVVLPPQYGAMAAQAMQRAQEAQELRDLYSGANYPGSLNIPYASTRARIKELGKYLGKDATAFERNQRIQQQRKQQIFEARRPAGASIRYV